MPGWVAEPRSCQKQQLMGTGFCPCSRLLPQGCLFFFSPGDARGRDGSVPVQEQIVPQRGRAGEEAFPETSLLGRVRDSQRLHVAPHFFCSLPRPASLFPFSGTLLKPCLVFLGT